MKREILHNLLNISHIHPIKDLKILENQDKDPDLTLHIQARIKNIKKAMKNIQTTGIDKTKRAETMVEATQADQVSAVRNLIVHLSTIDLSCQKGKIDTNKDKENIIENNHQCHIHQDRYNKIAKIGVVGIQIDM